MPLRWWVEGKTTPELATLTADPDSVLGGPGSVAREQAGRKRLYHLPASGDAPGLFVKVFTLPPGIGRLRYLLRPSKARREAEIARAVVARGFDAAVPIAVGEERRLGLLARSFSVIVERPVPDLRAALAEPTCTPARRRALIDAFAVFARGLHEAGIDQDDFSPNNFLVDEEARFTLIDFERCHIAAGPLDERRFTLLAKLNRRAGALSRSARLRFLRLYLGPAAGRAERRDAWQRIAAEFARIRRRDARRAAAAAFKIGRHVEREGDVWTMRARREAKVIRLDLDPASARRAWMRAYQLERLELPALRPVRLHADGVDMAQPDDPPALDAQQRQAAIARARRELLCHGRFVHEPEWMFAPEGALLRDPLAFDLA